MGHLEIDAVVRRVGAGAGAGATRRGALGVLAGGLGLLVVAPDWADAKKRKKRKKKKRKRETPPEEEPVCVPEGGICSANDGLFCCDAWCCLGVGEPYGGKRYCTPWSHVCCTAEQGGGACPPENPVCCPDGTCGRTEEECLLGINDRTGRVVRVDRLH